MWPACIQCGASVPNVDDRFCGGSKCIGKGGYIGRASSHKPFTKKKLTREMIRKRRKSGRK